MKQRIILFGLILVGTVTFAQSPEEKGLNTINRSSAEATIGFLASDELQGREAGFHGSYVSSEYIASILQWMGIQPLNESYFQSFDAYRKERQKKGRLEVHPDSVAKLKQEVHQKYFVQTCPFVSQIKGYLNFDMIGRNNKPEQPKHVVYFYTAAHPSFGDWLKKDIKKYGLQLEPDYRAWDNPVGGSDNGTFAKAGIPIIWYHTDGHPDYHQPSDHADRLNWDKIVEITKASFLNMWKMANEASW